jgi:hypothetical protein
MSRNWEWEDEGRMESEVALGFGGGGMARLDGLACPPMASASADGNCGDSVEETSIEGGADEAGPGKCSIVVFASSSWEDVMATVSSRGKRYCSEPEKWDSDLG